MTTANNSIEVTQDQALELHDAYWYAQCAMEGIRRGKWVHGEKAKASSRTEAMRLAIMSFEAAGATVDAARFPFSTPADLDVSSGELIVEVCGYAYRRGVDATEALPLPRRCSCGCTFTSWAACCADCAQ